MSVELHYVQQVLQRKLFGLDNREEENVKGKNVIVTGANAGLGYAVAEEFAKREANVILACRNLVEGQKAVDEIKKRTGSNNLDLIKLDLSDLESIKEFAKIVNEKYSEIHILINNAGIYDPNNKIPNTKQGFEPHFGVNYMGPFLLTNLIIEKLKSKDKSSMNRIIFVSSTTLMTQNLNFEDLTYENSPNRADLLKKYAYSNSKYGNALNAKYLAKKLEGECNVYALCPGLVNTTVFRDLNRFQYCIKRMQIAFVGLSPEQGAETILYCALSKKCANETGLFYRFSKPNEQIQKVLKDDDAEKLWNITEKLIETKN